MMQIILIVKTDISILLKTKKLTEFNQKID